MEQFGRISDVGVYAGFTNHFNIGAFMEKGLTMRGSQARPIRQAQCHSVLVLCFRLPVEQLWCCWRH